MLNTLPKLATLMVYSQQLLMDLLSELVEKDRQLVGQTNRCPNLLWLERQYPDLMDFLEDWVPGLAVTDSSLICHLISELYAIAAVDYWHMEGERDNQAKRPYGAKITRRPLPPPRVYRPRKRS
jgi:hypothetical protein